MNTLYFFTYIISLILLFNSCNNQESKTKTSKAEQELRMMTYNIKYDNPDDSLNSWEQRKNKVIGLFKYHQPDIIGTQEGLHHQLNDIKNSLTHYDWFGKGRKDGNIEGEFSAILYDQTKFDLKKDTTLWLSPTPRKPSQGWDAAFPRITTAGLFVNKKTQNQLWVFNTHFDHVGETARKKSAALLHDFIRSFTKNDLKYVLMGDFNVTPDSEPYKILTKPGDSLNSRIPLRDSYSISEIPHYGPDGTYTGFEVTQPERRIDYIFCSPDIKVNQHATLTDFDKMRFPSDHLPVVADVVFSQ